MTASHSTLQRNKKMKRGRPRKSDKPRKRIVFEPYAEEVAVLKIYLAIRDMTQIEWMHEQIAIISEEIAPTNTGDKRTGGKR